MTPPVARLAPLLTLCLAASCAGRQSPSSPSAATAAAARAVPFTVRSVPGEGTAEFVQGVALVGASEIDVLVTAARLADDGPRTRLLRLRAGVFEGDPAGRWNTARRSDAVAIARVRALGAEPGRDTVRLRIARTGGMDLRTRWLGFEIEGEVAPPGLPPGPGTRPLHGERGALAAR